MLVIVALIYIFIRFRDRGQPIPEQIHGKPALEITLTAIPAVIMAVIAGFTVPAVMALADTDDTECVVNVTGQQWWWEYDYPVSEDGTICGVAPTSAEASPIITSGQLVIPTGTKVLVRGTSRDVIHSFWIPQAQRQEGHRAGARATTCGWRPTSPASTPASAPSSAASRTPTCAWRRWRSSQPTSSAGSTTSSSPTRRPTTAPPPPKARRSSSSSARAVTRSTGSSTTRATTTRADDALVVSAPDEFVCSGAAPNLTNLMTRNTFAGATWDLLTESCRDDVWNATPAEFGEKYLEGVTEECLNEVDLREWLRDAPAKKPMYADPEELGPTDGKFRGMPYLALSEDQIDVLLAYLHRAEMMGAN